MNHLVFLDCETTGLDPSKHTIWEVAWKVAEVEGDTLKVMASDLLLMELGFNDLLHADPMALEVGGLRERYNIDPKEGACRSYLADRLRADAGGDTPRLVGSNPQFDDGFMRAAIGTPPWHYHLVDLPSVAAGWLYGSPNVDDHALRVSSLKSDALSKLCGVDPAGFDRHTAMGDVDWCVAWWAALFNLTVKDEAK